MKKLLSTILVFLVIGISPVVSLAGELEDAQEKVRLNPNDAITHALLGLEYEKLRRYEDAIASYKASIRLEPYWENGNAQLHFGLGWLYSRLSQF